MFASFIPTPTVSQISVGPLTIHAYALCIIAGIVVAIKLGDTRFRRAGGAPGVVSDIALWAVPAGVVGGRIYHVITTPEYFFGANGNFVDAFKIWQGGLGIWGAIAFGAAAAYWRYKKTNTELTFAVFADALAPGILIAQGIGRFGNWFNGELFGGPTTLPWALEIPSWLRPSGFTDFATFHPTFLYEAICNFLLALILIKLGDRFQPGKIFALYVTGYCGYRFLIEGLRIDRAHDLIGLRLNQWVSLVVGIFAALRFLKKGSLVE